MTVSEVLAAHASAQMAAARAADEARRVAIDSDPVEFAAEPRSIVESWAVSATVIGMVPN